LAANDSDQLLTLQCNKTLQLLSIVRSMLMHSLPSSAKQGASCRMLVLVSNQVYRTEAHKHISDKALPATQQHVLLSRSTA
jgi:hypothetical protein